MTLNVDTPIRRAAAPAFDVIPTGAVLGAEVRCGDLRAPRRHRLCPRAQGLARPFRGAVPRPGAVRPRPDRVQPPLRRSRLRPDPGERPPFRRGHAGDLHRLQRQGERRGDRQPRRRRGGVAHRHVVSRHAAQGEHALFARNPAARRQHRRSAACTRSTRRCPPPSRRASRAFGSSTTAPTISGGYVRQGVTPTDDPRTSPGALHPLVCTHPDTGRRMLYLGRRRNAYMAGLELAASEALLDELWGYVARPRVRVGARVARRRPRAVGQPLHHAPPRRLRSRRAAHHAPHPGQGRDAAGVVLGARACRPLLAFLPKERAGRPRSGAALLARPVWRILRRESGKQKPMRYTPMNRRDVLTLGASALCAGAAAPRALAQAKYPDRPIKLVVPFVPGGVNDAVARLWADRVKGTLGTRVHREPGRRRRRGRRRRGRARAARRLHPPARRRRLAGAQPDRACRSRPTIRSRTSSRSRSLR